MIDGEHLIDREQKQMKHRNGAAQQIYKTPKRPSIFVVEGIAGCLVSYLLSLKWCFPSEMYVNSSKRLYDREIRVGCRFHDIEQKKRDEFLSGVSHQFFLTHTR